MLNKLAWRNAKRSMRDYIVYLMTMVLITAVMFAFHSMIFSPSIQALCTEASVMGVMIGMATFFVVLIVVWLVHYMVKFLAEKRSREFATYLLLGFRKKQVAKLFLRENMLLGLAAFAVGLIPGFFLQQIMVTLIYAMVQTEYTLKLEINVWTFLLTGAVYLFAFVLALFRNKSRFRKMNIHDMMYLDKQNEQQKSGNKSGKKWMLFAALFYILFFGFMLYGEWITISNIWPLLAGLFAAIYFLYMGLAAFLVGYIRKGGEGVWKGANVFVLRQLASKIKTMQFTLGTLTILFSVALVGCACGLMLNRFQNTQALERWPFDIAVYSEILDTDFAKELSVISGKTEIAESYSYHIYQRGTDEVNYFLKKKYHIETWIGDTSYFQFDTYMKLSDYNYLRGMLGYEPAALLKDQYLIHTKQRVKKWMEEFSQQNLSWTGETFICDGIYTEAFEQSGHNGADYILVLPDAAVENMEPYYSVLMVMTAGEMKPGLKEELSDQLETHEAFDLYESTGKLSIDHGFGTDQIYITHSPVYVKSEDIREMKFILSALIFPLFYIGLVFLCVALTVLAVQQLSDANRYRFRYTILRKLGLKDQEIHKVVLQQLSWYYLFPFIAAFLLSVELAGYLSNQFAIHSGVTDPAWSYLAWSTAAFGIVYLIYFIATYVEFKKNI